MEQIKKVNVREEVFKSILNMIMQNNMAPGDKLPSENELKDSLGVSRHTVRDALNNLNMLGIIETKQGDGNYIKAVGVGLYMDFLIPFLIVNSKNLSIVMEFRHGIETAAAKYAAQRATDEDIDKLNKIYKKCENAKHDLSHYMEADLEFHYTIAEISRNDMLIQSMFVVKNYCYQALADFINEKRSSISFEFHTQIIDAIKNHEADLASKYMDAHMVNIINTLKEDNR